MAATKRKRPANFKFEMPVTEAKKQDIMQNLQSVREVLCRKLGKPVNNTDIMETLLETWKKSNDVCDSDEFKAPGTYTKVRKSQVNQNFFMTSLPSIRKLMDVVSSHGKYCKGILETKKSHKERPCSFFEIDLHSGRQRKTFLHLGIIPLSTQREIPCK